MYVWFKYNRQKHMYLKFDLTGIRTHDIQIMESIFLIHEMLALSTEPPGTS